MTQVEVITKTGVGQYRCRENEYVSPHYRWAKMYVAPW